MSKKKPAANVAAPGGNVNVIFRGLFIFIQHRDKLTKTNYLEIVMPNVGEEHVYKAGGFLQQTTLGPSIYPYGITHIQGGKAEFNPERNVILKDAPLAPNLTPAQVYAKFVLPQPVEIHSLCTTSPVVTAVDPLNLFEGRRLSSVQVLRYRSRDLANVRLFPHRSSVASHQTSYGNCVNIHISNDEDFDQCDGHTGYAVDRMFDLLPRLHDKVRLAYWEFPHQEYLNLDSLGILPDEILNSRDLHEKTLGSYARSLRGGKFTVNPPQGCIGLVSDGG